MPDINILAIIVAGIIPNALGALYFGPLFGKPWLASLGFTPEDMKGRNEALIYGGAFVISIIIAFFLKINIEFLHTDIVDGGTLNFQSYHSIKHGAFHAGLLGLALVAPVITLLGMFQKNTAKNILLNVVYWVLCFAIMGAILDAWS